MKRFLIKIKNIYYNHFSFNCFGDNEIFLESLLSLSNKNTINIYCHALLNNNKWLYNGYLFVWRNNIRGFFIHGNSIIKLTDISKIFFIIKTTRKKYVKIIDNININNKQINGDKIEIKY